MKVTEFQINDWVEFGGCPYKISSIKKSGAIEIEYSDGGMVMTSSSYIEDCLNPIIATEEMLEYNGFVEGFEYSDGNGNKIMINRETILILSNNNCIMHLKYDVLYVHILQHVLRLCGMDDLAKNWKVILK